MGQCTYLIYAIYKNNSRDKRKIYQTAVFIGGLLRGGSRWYRDYLLCIDTNNCANELEKMCIDFVESTRDNRENETL